ncbi:low affinity iron permease family protein [Arachidicoccus terrestris]|uniref:low affinity iron permease family protein n=1 Tax=Arachidicoccus terrestris TaxID=2875539 RepID=UPI001CC43B5B|nr:low affinity iron permease family protein [Arachidicoccus terrestris]UAY55902.1 low affinity iron permease family protein [Arachidicoccus terrestris]
MGKNSKNVTSGKANQALASQANTANSAKLQGPDTKRRRTSRLGRIFDRFSGKVTIITGSPWSFIVAFLVIVVWGVSGPIFDYSDTWQLVINTGTTIVTFLMVFVIQQSQNKDTMALQMKLNELIASNKRASNRLIDVEDLTEEELVLIKDYYIKLSSISKREKELQRSHSIEEMETSQIEEEIEVNEPAENKAKKRNQKASDVDQ